MWNSYVWIEDGDKTASFTLPGYGRWIERQSPSLHEQMAAAGAEAAFEGAVASISPSPTTSPTRRHFEPDLLAGTWASFGRTMRPNAAHVAPWSNAGPSPVSSETIPVRVSAHREAGC